MAKNRRSYIQGTDLLRCLGMLVVMSFHIEWLKSLYKIPSFAGFYRNNQFIHGTMTLFFVISGLVITTVLLKEKKATGTINVRHFYVRRAERIWPLYYLILAIILCGYFFHWSLLDIPSPGLSKEDVPAVLLINILPLTNFFMFLPSRLEGFGHAWSLGTEQQFYLVWPWVVKKFTRLKTIFVLIIVIKVIIKAITGYVSHSGQLSPAAADLARRINQFFVYFSIEGLAAGGLLACLMHEEGNKWIIALQKAKWQVVNIAVLIFLFLIPFKVDAFYAIIAICFCIAILGLNSSQSISRVVNSKVIIYLSDISYGIYMCQIPVLFVLFNLMASSYSEETSLAWNVSMYVTGILATVVVSVFSHELIEKRFYKKN